MNTIFPPIKCESLKHLWGLIVIVKIRKKRVREVITFATVKNRYGSKTYLLMDKEAYIVVRSELDGANGLTIDSIIL